MLHIFVGIILTCNEAGRISKSRDMKKTLSTIKQIAVITIILILFESCSNKQTFLTSSVVPAAEGTVKITNDKNNNYVIELNVIRLAAPDRLNPPKAVYVVWMQTEQNGIKNIGQLTTSSGFLSQTLKSSLETVSPFEPTEIMITAEDDAVGQYPGRVVLKTGRL